MSEAETKATVLKWLARSLAALLALLGSVMVVFAAFAFLSSPHPGPAPVWFVPVLGLILLMLGCTLLRTAFLVWFRWSPFAAQRLLQATFFVVFVWAIPILGNISSPLFGLLLLASFGIGALLVYHRAAEYFCRRAFITPPNEEVQSSGISG